MLVDFIFSAVRRGMVVAAKIKQGFKLRLVAVRQHRNMPPRRGWGMGWRGWLQRFRSGRSCEPARRTNRNAVAAFSPALERSDYAG